MSEPNAAVAENNERGRVASHEEPAAPHRFGGRARRNFTGEKLAIDAPPTIPDEQIFEVLHVLLLELGSGVRMPSRLSCSHVRGSPVWPFQKANNYFHEEVRPVRDTRGTR
jgi:hypothetical protein